MSDSLSEVFYSFRIRRIQKKIFEQKTYDDAIKQINKIRKNRWISCIFSRYLNKNFFPVYKRFIVFLKKEVKGKLENIINKCGSCIGKY